jgi:hypothetical protein
MWTRARDFVPDGLDESSDSTSFRAQLARRSLTEFQTTGRSRVDEDDFELRPKPRQKIRANRQQYSEEGRNGAVWRSAQRMSDPHQQKDS